MRYLFLLLILGLFTLACEEGANTEVDPETGEVVSKPKETPAQEMAKPTGEKSAIDGRYRLIDMAMNDQQLPIDSLEITALFKEGVLSGNSACNQYNTSFTVTPEQKITVGNIASTKKMCKGIMGFEQQYLNLLKEVTAYESLNANNLRLLSTKGALTFTVQDK